MTSDLEIRESGQADTAGIESLYSIAFPDEDLLPLVRDLSRGVVTAISLVGEIDSQIAGHAVFTMCGVAGSSVKAALLGPLAVAPAWQRRGIGTAIVRAGLRRLKDEGTDLICVLGDPAYYGRFGFVREMHVEPPFRLPCEWTDAWQSLYFGDAGLACSGKLLVPAPWLRPELWAP